MNTEYSFRLLVNIWAILRTPIPLNISMKKATSMVRAVCCLHNCLIDERDEVTIHVSTTSDMCDIVIREVVPLGVTPVNESSWLYAWKDGGENFSDVNRAGRHNHHILIFRRKIYHPREQLLTKLVVLGIYDQPKPIGSI